MATTLQSPGVNVSIIDQSFYTPAGLGTIPLIFVATAENKQNASGTGVAQGTTSAKAGSIYSLTSQRDLVDTFGVPYFDVDSGKNAINGSELSEYGLQAAYSVLGISSRAYVVRADIDLMALKGTSSIPKGSPVAGTHWLDTSDTKQFGINVWDDTTEQFTNVAVKIIDGSNEDQLSNGFPVPSFGVVGDYAMFIPEGETGQLYYKSSTLGWIEVKNTFDTGNKNLTISEHFNYPNFDIGTPTNSVWVCTTPINIGASWDLKYYNSIRGQWTNVNAPLHGSRQQAIVGLDAKGGGRNIAVNSSIVVYDYDRIGNADFTLLTRDTLGSTTFSITSSTSYQASPMNFYIRETTNTGTWGATLTINIAPTGGLALGQAIANVINTNTNLTNVSANYINGVLTFTHSLGGEIQLADGQPGNGLGPLSYLGITEQQVRNSNINNLYIAPSSDVLNAGQVTIQASSWAPLDYNSNSTAPNSYPLNDTLWFDTRTQDVDILWNDGSAWVGYRTAGAYPASDPAGPIISASRPTTQSDGTALVNGDIWIDSSDPEMYGQQIYVYNSVNASWVMQDVTDQVSPNGWVFGDARWSNTGEDDMEYIIPIADLLTSNYLDFDAPDARLYPKGVKLWNTRRSGNTVKQYKVNYVNINSTNPNGPESQVDYAPDRWVTVSGKTTQGVANFGRHAQRSMVTEALKSAVSSNTSVRDTDTLNYNLIATPGYTELIPTMVQLNSDIGQTAFVIGDTPMRLEPTATDLQNYGNGSNIVGDGEYGISTRDSFLGVYYPSGYTNDNYGRNIVVPPSHMMLRVFVNNDNVSYPWFAPAGTNRGIVNNAASVGYLEPITSEFKPASLYQGLRDTLATVKINPIATLPGSGLTVMGQYTRAPSSTALDRVNVARLVNYVRRQLTILSKPFLFEPNDTQTRNEIKRVIEGLMVELVTQRGLYDYIVVCDSSNNTPTRIDQNQLWVDIAIEPVKAVEFIYIPLRLLNTGAIATGNYGSPFPGNS
jgi:hypothetical protein